MRSPPACCVRPRRRRCARPRRQLRRYSVARVSLDDMKKVCRAFDVTLNDVCARQPSPIAIAALLLRRGEQPRGNALRLRWCRVSVRSANAFGQTGNQVSVMLPFTPIDQEKTRRSSCDCVPQAIGQQPRPAGQRQAGGVLLSAASYIPFMVSAWTVRVLTRLPQRPELSPWRQMCPVPASRYG